VRRIGKHVNMDAESVTVQRSPNGVPCHLDRPRIRHHVQNTRRGKAFDERDETLNGVLFV